jgi:hypothetical protein
MNTLTFEGLTAAVLVTLLVNVVSGADRLKRSVASFGSPESVDPMGDSIRVALAKQYMRQQAVAFGLVVVAIVLGLLFSSSILYQVVFAKAFRLRDAARAAALAGDIFIGRYASRAYKDACNRAEGLIKTRP